MVAAMVRVETKSKLPVSNGSLGVVACAGEGMEVCFLPAADILHSDCLLSSGVMTQGIWNFGFTTERSQRALLSS